MNGSQRGRVLINRERKGKEELEDVNQKEKMTKSKKKRKNTVGRRKRKTNFKIQQIISLVLGFAWSDGAAYTVRYWAPDGYDDSFIAPTCASVSRDKSG